MHGVRVRSLVRKLRFHMPRSQKPKTSSCVGAGWGWEGGLGPCRCVEMEGISLPSGFWGQCALQDGDEMTPSETKKKKQNTADLHSRLYFNKSLPSILYTCFFRLSEQTVWSLHMKKLRPREVKEFILCQAARKKQASNPGTHAPESCLQAL